MKNNAQDYELIATEVLALLRDYISTSHAGEGKVLDQIPAGALAKKLRITETIKKGDLEVNDVKNIVLPYLEHSQHMLHPLFVGHQVAVPHAAASIADVIHGVINNPMAIYEMGPSASVMERAMTNWLLKQAGWFHHDDICNFDHHSKSGAGVFTHGGSMANLTALLSARAAIAPEAWSEGTPNDLVVLGSELWHYSVARAISIMGMGSKNFLPVDVDHNGVITLQGLKKAYQSAIDDGKRIMCVVANACTTATGLYDPIDEMADFCNEKGIWFHVDGAHGAAALISPENKHLMKGVNKADSLIWDMHKMMRTTTLSAVVLFKNPQHMASTFQQEGSYIFHDKEKLGFDVISYALECTKSELATKLFWVLAAEGEAGLSNYVTHQYAITKEFHDLVNDQPDFECPYYPESNILCFRYIGEGQSDELQLKIRNKIVLDGYSYITSCDLNGEKFLRFTIMNDLTTKKHIVKILNDIRKLVLDLSPTL